jgi:hypothetical protein
MEILSILTNIILKHIGTTCPEAIGTSCAYVFQNNIKELFCKILRGYQIAIIQRIHSIKNGHLIIKKAMHHPQNHGF